MFHTSNIFFFAVLIFCCYSFDDPRSGCICWKIVACIKTIIIFNREFCIIQWREVLGRRWSCWFFCQTNIHRVVLRLIFNIDNCCLVCSVVGSRDGDSYRVFIKPISFWCDFFFHIIRTNRNLLSFCLCLAVFFSTCSQSSDQFCTRLIREYFVYSTLQVVALVTLGHFRN